MTNPLHEVWPAEQAPTGTQVCVIGAGYVGLTVAAGLAHLGHTVVAADSATSKVRRLRAGRVPFLERGLPELVGRMHHRRRLTFTTDTMSAAAAADIVFLCLPTPQGAGGQADLRHVLQAAEQIGPSLRSGAIVVTKSTVPVGTADMLTRTFDRTDITVVSNPEFLAEGTALQNFFAPDRIVIGSVDADAAATIAALYAALPGGRILTDVRSAELIKYASNAFLATKLSFVNSMAELCEATGADITAVAGGMGSDHRIGPAFLRPGPGWGGSCFPKDTEALVRIGAENGIDLPLIRSAIRVNRDRRRSIVRRIVAAAPIDRRDFVVAVWGLTYKAGTDDLRDSPSIAIIADLLAAGATVQAYDPTRSDPIAGVDVRADEYEACRDADVLVIATEWPRFAAADFSFVRAVMAGDTVIDTRNLLDAAAVRAAGLAYSGMGTRPEAPRRGLTATAAAPLAAVPH